VQFPRERPTVAGWILLPQANMKLVIGFLLLACAQVAYAGYLVWRKRRVVSDPNLNRIVGRILK
jgi:hypothetical protein